MTRHGERQKFSRSCLLPSTAAEVVKADAQGKLEDGAVIRARIALVECERKLAKHLDGLEAGIPAEVIASRITATQHAKDAALAVLAVLAVAPAAPEPLSFEMVVETLATLRICPNCWQGLTKPTGQRSIKPSDSR